jgi:hypothetical protein
MLKMGISDWKKRIDRQFDAGLYDSITIHGSVERKTKEITNFEFCLVPETFDLVPPPVEEEQVERDFILNRSLEIYDNYLSKDINSRQGAFVNNYDEADNHCISYFHHYVRDKKHSLNVYVRSMDYIRNFEFDCQTFNLTYNSVFEKLKKQYPEIEQGYIRVFVFSLHIYL